MMRLCERMGDNRAANVTENVKEDKCGPCTGGGLCTCAATTRVGEGAGATMRAGRSTIHQNHHQIKHLSGFTNYFIHCCNWAQRSQCMSWCVL